MTDSDRLRGERRKIKKTDKQTAKMQARRDKRGKTGDREVTGKM